MNKLILILFAALVYMSACKKYSNNQVPVTTPDSTSGEPQQSKDTVITYYFGTSREMVYSTKPGSPEVSY